MNEPKYLDTVKNKISNVTGIVDAKYQDVIYDEKSKKMKRQTFIDVKIEDKMHYYSPIKNWEVIKIYDESRELQGL